MVIPHSSGGSFSPFEQIEERAWKRGNIRADGLTFHDMFLFQVKTPEGVAAALRLL
jgi:hypothetical protein